MMRKTQPTERQHVTAHRRAHLDVAAGCRSPLGPKRGRNLLVAAASAILVTVTPTVSAAAIGSQTATNPGADRSGFVEIGRLPVTPPDISGANLDNSTNGWMILNPGSRRAYQLFEESRPANLLAGELPPGAPQTVMQSFDLNTLDPVRAEVLTDLGTPIRGGVGPDTDPNSPNLAGEVVHAVDPEGKRLFIAISERRPRSHGTDVFLGGPDAKPKFSHIAVIDEGKFEKGEPGWVTEVALPPSQGALLDQHRLTGILFTRAGMPQGSEGKLLLFFAAQPLNPLASASSVRPAYDHYVAQWDLGNAMAQSAVTDWGDWAELLSECGANSSRTNKTSAGFYQTGMLRTARSDDHAVYVACLGSPGEASGRVVRVGLSPATSGPIPLGHTVYPLGRNIVEIIADQIGERLYLRQRGAGTTWWVFDAKMKRFRSSFVGYQESGRAEIVGLDPLTGRFYALIPDTPESPGGLAYTDGRLNPVPQLTRVRSDLAYPGLYAILVDPVTNRIFVRRGKGDNDNRYVYPSSEQVPAPPEFFYRVLEDRIPIANPPEDDGQRRTIDVDEAHRLTSVSYRASGSGFGTRLLFTGGLDAITANAASIAQSTCGSDDRELTFGHVISADLTQLNAAASASGANLSSSTRDDLASPISRCRRDDAPSTLDGVEGQSFSREAMLAECADQDEASRDRDVNGQRYEAEVACDHKNKRAAGSARAAVAVGALPITVDDSRSDVSVERLDDGGVTVLVDSVAHGIKIEASDGSRVSIGAVRLEAEVFANGRTRGAKTRFVRTICAVESSRFQQSACTSDPDQHQQIAEAISRALGGQGEARVRMPDPQLATGTEAGDQAAIQRNELDRFQDRIINRDESLEIPGLELILFQGDDPDKGAGRQIFHFAGAFATTSYTIQCLFGFMADAKACSPPPSFDVPAGIGGGTGSAPSANEQVPGAGPTAVQGGQLQPGDPGYDLVSLPGGTATPTGLTRPDSGGGDGGFLDYLTDAGRKAFRFLFGRSLGEAALLAALWGLLFLPCYLGERWRLLVRLRADPSRSTLAA